MRQVSARALKAFYSQETAENVIVLMKIYGSNIAEPRYLANGYVKRLEDLSTDDDVFYGVTTMGHDWVFCPFNFTFPQDDTNSGLRADITISNATRYITPLIRTLTAPPLIDLHFVLQGESSADNSETVSDPEITIQKMELRGINYTADSVTGYLSVESLASEPCPSHTMTPSYCPGLY